MGNGDNERFRKFFKDLKITQVALARLIGVSKTNVTAWMKDHKEISGDMQKRIIKVFPDLNVRWFLFGEGENYGTNKVAEPLENYK